MTIARRLYELGFNVICVGRDKRPYGSWSAERRQEAPPECSENVAITGNYFFEEDYKTVIIDVDDPKTDALERAFGSDWAAYLCGQPWSFCVLTGARPKGQVLCADGKCTVYRDRQMQDVEAVVDVDKVERGLAVVVRVPAQCVGKGFSTVRGRDVELIYNNYQVVAGVHPSGLPYEAVRFRDGVFVRDPEGIGPGVVISCEEFHRLAAAVRGSLRLDEAREEAYQPPSEWNRTIRDKRRLAEILKTLWRAERPEGGHFHDWLTFGIASVAWRYGVKFEEISEVFEEVFKWAVENGLDTERDVAHHRSVVKWVYSSDEGRRRWGGRRVREALLEVLRAMHEHVDEKEADALFSEILEALGVDRRRPEDVTDMLCVVIDKTSTDGAEMPVAWICNTPFGIVHVTKQVKRRRDGEGEEVVKNEKKLVDVTITSATLYRDVVAGREYVDASVVAGERPYLYRMTEKSLFVAKIDREHRVRRNYDWVFLLNRYPAVEDVIVSGFLCPPPDHPILGGLPCGVRDYFDTGITRPDRAKARNAIEAVFGTFEKFSPSEHWFEAVATAYVHALAQVFFFTRKVWRVRPSFLALIGPHNAGKSSVALLALHTLFPKRAKDLFIGSYASMSPARIGRLLSAIVAGVIVLDEQRVAFEKTEVFEVLKSWITHDVAWKTAHGESWPASAGIVMVANSLHAGDPEVADKIYTVQFPGGVDMAKRVEFATAFGQLTKIVADFGGFYLHFATERWPEAKDAVLAPTQAEAADRYFRLVAEELGVAAPKLLEPSELSGATVAASASDLFRKYVWDVLLRQMPSLNTHNITMREAVISAVVSGRLPYVRKFGEGYVLIERGIERAIGVNIRTLCAELGGELYVKSRNARYYGSCIVEDTTLANLFDEEVRE